MAQYGPVLIVEDDANDADVIVTAAKEIGLKNELKVFPNAQEAYQYLLTTADKPMVIICDVRMPGLDGLSFLKQICANEYLRMKAIPFIFFSGAGTQSIVNEAYRVGIQGFYKKAASYEKIKEQLYAIFVYWNQCLHPMPERPAELPE